MKFVIVVVMLALALGAQSSIIPLSAHLPISYTAVSGPTLLAAHPAAITLAESPATIALTAPAFVAPVHVPVIAAEGSYIAKTRGAVHVAPLPGHLNSAASINLEPAPGTL